jgi:calcineurin-like phosphoesterase family protein
MILDEDTDKLKQYWYKLISQLNGKYKFLVLGNNDLLNRNFYVSKCGFNTASLSLKLDNIIFTHVPTHTGTPELINIHGHVHRDGERRIWVNTTGERCIKDNKPFSYINETNIPITKPIKLVKVLESGKYEI